MKISEIRNRFENMFDWCFNALLQTATWWEEDIDLEASSAWRSWTEEEDGVWGADLWHTQVVEEQATKLPNLLIQHSLLNNAFCIYSTL